MKPLISICIPAYKRENYLKRLLDSIAIQTFTGFEVVLTDDSKDDSVGKLMAQYASRFPLVYVKNSLQLGTPENWNESIRQAGGEWIKLMHDDDWFTGPGSLGAFAAAIRPDKDFIFSAYCNVYEGSGRIETARASRLSRRLLASDPAALLSRNLVGPPSVTLYRKTELEYDKRMKWRVDIDFYVHYLQTHAFLYINEPLVNIGISEEQVTQSCFLVPAVEIPENFLLLQKIGTGRLKNVLAYDSWWRLMRNLNIRSLAQIEAAGYHGEVPAVIRAIIRRQRLLSSRLLKIGPLSKLLMLVSYLRGRISKI